MASIKKTIIGLTEKVTIHGKRSKKKVTARIDTGATKGSIDAKLAASLILGPVIKRKIVKSAAGHSLRPIIRAKITMKKRTLKGDFTIADRSHMKYSVLIGQDILKQGFLIDPSI